MTTRLFATRFSFYLSICILLPGPGMGWLTAAELNTTTNHSNRDPTTVRAPQKVPDFELKDQHNVTRAYQFPRDKISLLTVADRKGSDQIEAWVRPIKQRYGDRIDIDGVADMSTVPPGLRTLVRNAFKDQLTYSVMLDWEGRIANSFKYKKNEANLFIIGKDGTILFRTSGPANETNLNRLFEHLDRALKVPSSGG